MDMLEAVTKLRLTAAEELKRRNAPLPRAQADLIRQRFRNLFTPQMILDLLDEITCRAELAVLRSEQIGRLQEKLEKANEAKELTARVDASDDTRQARQAALDRLHNRIFTEKVFDDPIDGTDFDFELMRAFDRLMRRWGTKE